MVVPQMGLSWCVCVLSMCCVQHANVWGLVGPKVETRSRVQHFTNGFNLKRCRDIAKHTDDLAILVELDYHGLHP